MKYKYLVTILLLLLVGGIVLYPYLTRPRIEVEAVELDQETGQLLITFFNQRSKTETIEIFVTGTFSSNVTFSTSQTVTLEGDKITVIRLSLHLDRWCSSWSLADYEILLKKNSKIFYRLSYTSS